MLVIENGWLSATQFQVPISWGGPLTASDKDRCPCTLLSHFQVSLGSDSEPLTTCHSLAGWDCWKGSAASKLLMSPNGKPLNSGIQVLLLLHHSDPLYELGNSCLALANTMLTWLCVGSGIQQQKGINKIPRILWHVRTSLVSCQTIPPPDSMVGYLRQCDIWDSTEGDSQVWEVPSGSLTLYCSRALQDWLFRLIQRPSNVFLNDMTHASGWTVTCLPQADYTQLWTTDELLRRDFPQQDVKGCIDNDLLFVCNQKISLSPTVRGERYLQGQCWELSGKLKVSGACRPADALHQCFLHLPTAKTMANKNAEAQSVPSVKKILITKKWK